MTFDGEGAPRVVTVWCPDWPVAAARASGVVAGSAPAAVVRANRVVARSSEAARAGVTIGQRRRDAQRCCPELQLVDHDPARDAREFEPVIRAVAEMAPRLDVIEPGWILLAARGPSRYFGGDRSLSDRLGQVVHDVMIGRLRRTGGEADVPVAMPVAMPVAVAVGIGVADGRMASAVAARRAAAGGAGATSLVVPPGGSPDFLAPLPVGWLVEVGDADVDLLDVWRRLGLRTLGDVASLPAADVLARFGRAGARAHALAGGSDERPPDADAPPPDRHLQHVFDEPVVQVSTAVFVAKQLADRLVASLAAEGRVCTRLRVVAETDHGERSERSWYRDGGLSAPAMVERVRWQLDGWIGAATPTAGITLVRLVPDEIRADDGVQLGLWGGRTQADHDAARAVTRLVALAGDEAVTVPAWSGGRLPVDRYRWVPASSVDLDDPAERLTPGPGRWPGALPAPSPAVVPVEPASVSLLDPSGREVRVGGRGEISGPPDVVVVGAQRRRVVEWAGPWPLEQAWWDPRRRRRLARFQVVLDDGSAHLLAVERQRWWWLATYA